MDNKYNNRLTPDYWDYYTVIQEGQPGFTARPYNGIAQQMYHHGDIYNALKNDPVAREEYINRVKSLPEYGKVIPNRLWDIMAQQGYAQDILKRSNYRMNEAYKSTPFYNMILRQIFNAR